VSVFEEQAVISSEAAQKIAAKKRRPIIEDIVK